ncbi:DUF421 domain-containing protein [Bacillus suaedaesalsae]|uniref:DUF421 domain-containing protein n=1 Tax=Bacillus suaedaesalsae TaxID=2810349 RepID=A0ABS2DM19_9BACI|nr:DUF421 domain-containing protein [Bacillus suaedaesalsae]MBM6619532.1 DUF421 domain-containing protein [Bacillus suaedaesalsae]
MPEWIEIASRALLFIFALFLLTKLLGKKQISEISFFEYVSGITIGSIAAEVIMKLESSIIHGLVGIFVFGFVTVLVDFLSIKSKKFREIAEGKATIFIQDGKVLEDNLKKERYSLDELNTLLRKKDVFSFSDVEFAVLEPSGELSVLLKKEHQPVTLKDLNIKTASEKEPQTVIMDGKIIHSSLVAAAKSLNWLHTELDKMSVTLENVFLAQVNSYGELTVDIYDDKIQVPTPQERPLLMAMMKKCEADLESFALQTESETAKKMYQDNAEKLESVIRKLTPYLNG